MRDRFARLSEAERELARLLATREYALRDLGAALGLTAEQLRRRIRAIRGKGIDVRSRYLEEERISPTGRAPMAFWIDRETPAPKVGDRVRFDDGTYGPELGTVETVSPLGGATVVRWDSDQAVGVFSPVAVADQLTVVTGEAAAPRHVWNECDVCRHCAADYSSDRADQPCPGRNTETHG